MTDEPPNPEGQTPEIVPVPGPRLWPRVLGVAILLLGAGGAWLWQNPDTFDGLFSRPSADAGALKALEARVARLEQRTDPTARIEALEKAASRPAAAAPAPDVRSLIARLDALEHAAPAGDDSLARRLVELERQVDGLTAKGGRDGETSDRVARQAQAAAAAIALAAGQPLGVIPDAPPALARFATEAPPTEAALRLAFPAAEQDALKASVPDTEGKDFLGRVLARVQDFRLVTVREGDHVLIGNQAAEILARARTALDAGDLAGAARIAASLTGPPRQKMAPWLDRAQMLLAAREALAALARNG